ncbi:MAG: outer membrane beta-barrel protein [bacterium]|nr:outer membrane beta-barrel protein [bacterium]
MLVLAAMALLGADGVRADDHDAGSEAATQKRAESNVARFWDAERFYFWFQSGETAIVDTHIVSDLFFDTPNGINVMLGGGGGYNIDEHWSVEFQGHGTEPDVRSKSLGKVREYSNITLLPSARFRLPIDGGPWVPWASAGLGWSINDVNDNGNSRVKLEADESTIAGSVAIGLDYFVSPNVAVGLSVQGLIYPNQTAEFTYRNANGKVVRRAQDEFNLSSINTLAHIRLFPGQQGSPDGTKKRTFLLADEGPFDTSDLRFYLYFFGGHTEQFSKDFGGPLTLEAPGDFNATLGGGLGLNFDRHWGAEVQLMNTDPNMEGSPYGKMAEVSNFTVLPMVRFRWPFLGGRLVPSVRAGVGYAQFTINDKRGWIDVINSTGTAARSVATPKVTIDSPSVAGSVQLGLEYFLNHNLSFGVSVPFYLYPDADTTVKEVGKRKVNGSANFSGVAGLLEIRAYLP